MFTTCEIKFSVYICTRTKKPKAMVHTFENLSELAIYSVPEDVEIKEAELHYRVDVLQAAYGFRLNIEGRLVLNCERMVKGVGTTDENGREEQIWEVGDQFYQNIEIKQWSIEEAQCAIAYIKLEPVIDDADFDGECAITFQLVG
jgi:hypothetical protein